MNSLLPILNLILILFQGNLILSLSEAIGHEENIVVFIYHKQNSMKNKTTGKLSLLRFVLINFKASVN